MISWIVIVILVIAGIIAIKMNHLRHRIFIIILILIALFLYTSMTLIVKDNALNLNSVDGLFNVIKVYTGWLANGFQNLKVITGNALGMDWGNTNSSFTDKDSKKINEPVRYGRG